MQITSIGEVHIQILGGIDYCCHWQMPYLSKNSSINGGEYPHEVGQSIFPLRSSYISPIVAPESNRLKYLSWLSLYKTIQLPVSMITLKSYPHKESTLCYQKSKEHHQLDSFHFSTHKVSKNEEGDSGACHQSFPWGVLVLIYITTLEAIHCSYTLCVERTFLFP